ncbi:MAG TPA: TetR/AcrR family transcriptional regulator [Kineosporiaceae bacterium]|nr:TetR/AcrR family transcriptional regulator [Kineosporiaceae bacterium]
MSPPIGLRERKKQRTRRVIQRAALQLFAEHGFRETTIAQIAEAADVSLRTVTVHFPAKEDLVLALGSQSLEALVHAVEARPAGVLALDAMRDWIAQQVEEATDPAVGDDSSDLLRLIRTVTEANPDLAMRVRGSDLRLEGMLTVGIAEDLGLAPDALAPRLAAAAVMAGIRTVTNPLLTNEHGTGLSGDEVLVLLNKSLTFARAGLEKLGTVEQSG